MKPRAVTIVIKGDAKSYRATIERMIQLNRKFNREAVIGVRLVKQSFSPKKKNK